MNKFILLFSMMLSGFWATAQIDISEARNLAEGTDVTIEGIAINGSELGIIRYFQDATGGIAVYPGTGSVADFPESVNRGDRVEISGTLKSFNGLLEIDPVTSFNVISSGNMLPEPLAITPNGINEENESKLLRVNGVTFADGGGTFNVGNYAIEASGEQGEIYIRSNHPLIGSDIPLATVNLTGIGSQFNSIYQLLPRDINDLEIADNFYFTSLPVQSNLTNDGFELSWNTNVMGTTRVEYGTTSDLGQEVTVSGMTTNHNLTITGLEPATAYYVKATSDSGSSVIESTIRIFSTTSNSSGDILVYFNHGVDGSFSSGDYPDGTTSAALEAAIINRINSAQSTIDVSAYNNNRTTIVEALSDAHDSGIQVRYIADDQTANLALENPVPPFPVLKGNNGDPLMHNKFIIIDAESVDDSWVFTGSTNFTSQNLATDYNNSIFIQDQALARAYTTEFEEMWGSDGPNPGFFNVKFGENKEDNTPHLFNINGVMIESYFSPSDNTSINIGNALATTDTDLAFALLTFTKNELGTAVRDVHNSGASVRGIINNINDTGSEFDWLVDQGVNVLQAAEPSKDIHHKYAIVDATNPGSDPMVITGSHNWSNSADVRNDENTLIIHDADIANIFLQEFEARWCESTMGLNCITATEDFTIEGFDVVLSPNPASEVTVADMNIENTGDLTIALTDMNGRILHSIFLKNAQGDIREEIFVKGLPAGMYTLVFRMGTEITSRPLMIVK